MSLKAPLWLFFPSGGGSEHVSLLKRDAQWGEKGRWRHHHPHKTRQGWTVTSHSASHTALLTLQSSSPSLCVREKAKRGRLHSNLPFSHSLTHSLYTVQTLFILKQETLCYTSYIKAIFYIFMHFIIIIIYYIVQFCDLKKIIKQQQKNKI